MNGLVSSNPAKEKLFVVQEQDDLLLSLYLHQGIVNNLESNQHCFYLHGDNLEDFCMALEGISHFLYIIWNASHARSVTRLEMELQAEVDKFVMLSKFMQQQSLHPSPGQLRQLLFETVSYHHDLTEHELQRYRDANNYAEKYCWRLESGRYLEEGSERDLLNELRRFYRLNLSGKLRRINYRH